MEDPVQEIGPVVHKLTQGSPIEQKEALETYFTEDAAFYHPFCRVDSARGSREWILCILRWYKIMSPKIDLEIQSIAYDEVKQILYVTIHQDFAIWFLFGLHNADVVLTTKLQLEKRADRKYYIKSQNDLYQTDQFVKFFTLPRGIGAYLVYLWQSCATLGCVFLAYAFGFFTLAMQWWIDQGGRDKVKQVEQKSAGELLGEARLKLSDVSNHTANSLGQTVEERKDSRNQKTQQHGKMQVIDTK